MSKWTLKDLCLLDVFGELPKAAREKLVQVMKRHSTLRKQHETLSREFAVLQSLPIPEPSAQERREIPARIKKAVHRDLRSLERRERAGRWFVLIRGATLAGACAALLTVSFLFGWHPAKTPPAAPRSSPAASPVAVAPAVPAENAAHLGATDQTGYADAQARSDEPYDDYFVAEYSNPGNDGAPPVNSASPLSVHPRSY